MGKEQRTRNKEQGAMRSLSLRIFGYVLMSIFIVSCFSSLAPHAFAYPFLRDLSLGVRGEDVRQLQIELNKLPETQISQSDAGSPGQETDYFGPKTHAAVVRYQNLHASKILAPLGLTTGTGYVGPSTRAMLGVTPTSPQPPIGSVSTVPTPQQTNTLFTSNPLMNPPRPTDSKAYLDFMKKHKNLIVTQGLSRSTLPTEDREVLEKQMADAIEAMREEDVVAFFDAGVSSQSIKTISDIENVVNTIREQGGADEISFKTDEDAQKSLWRLVLGILAPQEVYAQALIPFGGFVFPITGLCNCPPVVVRVVIAGPSWTSGSFDYILGTQGFGFYNFPYATYAMGQYTTVVGSCWTYAGTTCAFVQGAIGTITPIVGTGAR